MLAQWLLGVSLSTLMAMEAPTEAPDLAGYEAVKAAAGRDGASQVKVALWCEAHGLSAERLKHLALAVLTDPKNVTARGLLGLVEFRNRWERPESVSRKVHSDEELTAKLAEYNARRARASRSADDHWKLAVWCEEVGLDAEARAHFSTVTRLDPAREAAWKRLECKKVGNRWLTQDQIDAEKAEADAQKKADLHWKPLLTKWHAGLREKDKSRRDRAEENLASVTDPRAVPAVLAVFGGGDAIDQERAVRVLGGIDAGTSSRGLAMLSVFGKTSEVRRAAAETLKRRDSRDFLGLLVNLLRDPLKYEVRPGVGPGGVGELFVEGQRYDVRRLYGLTDAQLAFLPRALSRPIGPRFDAAILSDPISAQNYWIAMGPLSVHVANGHGGTAMVTNPNVLAARRNLEAARQQAFVQSSLDASRQELSNDVGMIESYNANAREVNAQALPVLSALTAQEATGTSEEWKGWWSDQQGYVYASQTPENKPTLTEFVPNRAFPSHSCFGARTPVRTLDGPIPIESIQVGDQVLSQDTKTGRLSFVPVLAVFHNKPAATLKVELSGTSESVVATGIHRFWKAGQGWVMARELKPGDILRTVGGTARVGSVETQPVQPVFNLEVGPSQSYFVGDSGLLVHDNSLVNPVPFPFDAPPTLAGLSSGR